MISFADDGKTLNPIAPHERDWALFLIFALAHDAATDMMPGMSYAERAEWWDSHIDWLRRAHVHSPDAWLSGAGGHYRAAARHDWRNPRPAMVTQWRRFKAAHANDSLDEIDRLLAVFLHDA
jgi:hypothetical protein